MNLQDVRYVAAIAEAGSISRAAERLLVAQPSLSKCVQKVEREYGVTLFARSRGSASELTAEGEMFLKMAREILASHDYFTEQLKRRKQQERNNIMFGTTSQRAFNIVDPLCKKLHDKAPEFFITVHVKNSASLWRGLRDGSLDMAILGCVECEKTDLYYEPLCSSEMGVFLRTGSPVAQKAIRRGDMPYPVLRLEDLAGEPFVVNLPGSSSRKYMETLMGKAGISPLLIELPNYQNRLALVKNGQANLFTLMDHHDMPEYFYCIDPEQNITVTTYLVCSAGKEKSPKFKAVYQCLREIFEL